MRHHLLPVAVAALLLLGGAGAAWAAPEEASGNTFETAAAAAVLMEPASGQILYEKDPYKELPIASVTKIMTMLLAVEAVDAGKAALDDVVVTSEFAAGMGGSQIYLAPQEEMSFKEMLISIATGSANDASVAVGEHLAGSVDAFVQQMNERAAALGLEHTRFVNPTGLPAEGHYSCAHDQAVILREALRYPLFKEVSKVKEYDLRGGEFKLWNTNKLLWWYPGAESGKTGWTNEAHYCLASSVIRDDLRLVAVVLGVPEPKGHFRESMKLYNWGFARFEAVVLARRDELIKTVPVEKGVATTVDLVVPRDVTAVVPRGEKDGVEFRVELPDRVSAPLAAGVKVGDYVVVQDGKELLRVEIVAAEAVAEASFLDQLRRLTERMAG